MYECFFNDNIQLPEVAVETSNSAAVVFVVEEDPCQDEDEDVLTETS